MSKELNKLFIDKKYFFEKFDKPPRQNKKESMPLQNALFDLNLSFEINAFLCPEY